MNSVLAIVIREFHQALTETMHDYAIYTLIVKTINMKIDRLGRECVLDLFTELVEPIQTLIDFLEPELFDAGLSNLKAVREWLRCESLNLFMDLCEIHRGHVAPLKAAMHVEPVISTLYDELYC